jgi:beta-fructofuranosidase
LEQRPALRWLWLEDGPSDAGGVPFGMEDHVPLQPVDRQGHPRTFRQERQLMRPEFHFTAKSGWINDPHGITARNGGYELFFQYVPDSLVWAPSCHWGHATGSDLFTWEERPIALAPGDGDDGIWTGSIITDEAGRTRIFYTSVELPNLGVGKVRVATARDDSWVGWEKGAVVATVPDDLDVIAYRDPVVVREGRGWRMFVGAGLAEGDAAALSYTSADLETWTYSGITARRSKHEKEPAWMGAMWECPQMLELDGRHVLVSSVWENDVLHYAGYGLGTYADGVFRAETWGQLTFGPSYYAPSLFRDEDGRPCLTFWMRGVQDAEDGWTGAHSVPHVLRLSGDRLVAEPHPDLARYHIGEQTAQDDHIVTGPAFDSEWLPSSAPSFLSVSSGGQVLLSLERRNDGLLAAAGSEQWEFPYDGGAVRVILDGPVAEVSSDSGLFGVAVESHSGPLIISRSSGSTCVTRALEPGSG